MKKQIIAAAVAAAFAVPAMAQVTVGGNFDISYDFGKQNEANKVLDTQGAMSTSALTLAGSEDLGGGLKAYFNINSRLGQGGQVNGDVGSGQAAEGTTTVANRQGTINFGDRGFQVGVSGGFGDVAFGKTPGTAMGATIRGGVAGNLSLLQESSLGDRPNNMVSYTTPKMGAFTGRLVYVVETESYEVSGSYTSGNLVVNAAYADVKAFTDAVTQGATNDTAGTDMGLRIGYNLGFAALNVSYIKGETGRGGYATDSTQYSVGVTVPAGSLSYFAEYGDRNSGSTTAAAPGDVFYNVGAVYNLSKRTNIYGVYNKATDAYSTALTTDAAEPKMIVGVRHSF